MSLKTRLTVSSVIPLVVMTLLGLTISYFFWGKYKDAQRAEKLSYVVEASLKLVHELQKERGMSTGFVGSSGQKFSQELKDQRKKVDESMERFFKILEESSLVGQKKVAEKLQVIRTFIKQLPTVRSRIDSLQMDKGAVVNFYTGLNAELIGLTGLIAHYTGDVHIAAKIVALEEFSRFKDVEGIKRALLSVVFAVDRFEEDLLERYLKLSGKQEAFLEVFYDVAPDEYIKIFEEVRTSPQFRDAEDLERLALTQKENFGVSPERWFEVQTRKINLLKQVEDSMISNLINIAKQVKGDYLLRFSVMSVSVFVVLLVVSFITFRTVKLVNLRIESAVKSIKDLSERMEFSKVKVDTDYKDEFTHLEEALISTVRSIGKVIEVIKSVMEKVAQGHFSQRVRGDFKGDLKALADNVNVSLDNLQKTMDSIKEVMGRVSKGDLKARIEGEFKGDLKELVDYVNSSIHQLQELLKRIKEDILEVTSNLASITTSVDETSEAIRQISEETLKARNLSNDMSEAIDSGKQKVNDMHSAMENIVKVSKDIGSITETIINIAEQTNLLALNASIEAARAGEIGRGFAVVAEEVRRLAEISGNAAKEIAQLVERVSKAVEEGRGASKEVVDSYARIEEVVKEVVTSIDTIATAMEEQSRAVDIIRDNVANISSSTERIEENVKKFEV